MQKLEKIYEGKAKILYTTEDPALLIQYFKDDATAFNAQKRGTIAEKGIMNNRIASTIFEHLKTQGIDTHFVEWLNDREMLVKRVEIIPLEIIVRNRAAGSLCRLLGLSEGANLACPPYRACPLNSRPIIWYPPHRSKRPGSGSCILKNPDQIKTQTTPDG